MDRLRTTAITAAATFLLIVTLAACGGATAESEAAEPSTTASTASDTPDPAASEAPASEPAQSQPAEAPGEAGSFTVDGTTFAATLLNRCIPFSDQPGNIDLQVLAQGAQLNLVLLGGTTEVSVQGNAVEELAGSLAFDAADGVTDSSVSGDRWTGSATAVDSLGSGASVDLIWDVMIPDEVRDCSL